MKISKKGKSAYARFVDGGEISSGKKMGYSDIRDYFARLAADTLIG